MIQKPLGKILVEEGYINNYQLSEALIIQRENPHVMLGDILIQLKYLTQERLNEVLKKQTESAKITASKKTESFNQSSEHDKALAIANKELSALIRLLIKKKLIKGEEYFRELKGG
ncbi:MAG: hypothetical protein AABZ11_00610 [Nitrospinota bacterium]